MDIQKLKTALQKATARGRVALIGHDAPEVDSGQLRADGGAVRGVADPR